MIYASSPVSCANCGMVLDVAAARRRRQHARSHLPPGPVRPTPVLLPPSPAAAATAADEAAAIGSFAAALPSELRMRMQTDAELSELAQTVLSDDKGVLPASKLNDSWIAQEAMSVVAEDARYRGRLDERQESQRVFQQQSELHVAELSVARVKAELEQESLKLQAKLDALMSAAEARLEAEEREEQYRQRAEAERQLRQEAEAEALEARRRTEQLEAEQKAAEQRRREAERSAGQQLRDQKRQLAAIEARLAQEAEDELRWKEHIAALRIQGMQRVRQARRELERLAYEKRRETKRQRNAAATVIQAAYRGHVSRVRNASGAFGRGLGPDSPFQNARSPFARAGSLFQHVVEREWRGGSVANARWKEAARWQGQAIHATWQEAALETALMRGSAALRIQSQFRGWHARRHQTDRQASALTVQRIWRGWSARNRLKRTAAAMALQAAFRAWFRGTLVRRWLRVELDAATRIQARWRGWLLRDQRKLAFRSATSIQALFRGWRVRVWMRQRADAATVIQACVRGANARKVLDAEAAAAAEIQKAFRGWQLRQALGEGQQAATYIQKMYRGFSCRAWLVWNINAANAITAAWRGYMLRRNMKRARAAVVVIQRRWRGWLVRTVLAEQLHAATEMQRVQRGRLARRMMHRRHRAAAILQALTRAHLVQQEMFERIAAARMIQGMMRGRLARNQLKRELKAVQMIQAVQRGWAVRKTMRAMHRAASRVQAVVRGRIVRKDLWRQMDSATVIQAVCRAHLEMSARWTELDAAMLIERVWRGAMARQEARRRRLAKERYRAAQIAEFDRMRAEIEAEVSADSEAAQIARGARLRMAVDAVETVFPRPGDADYHIAERHAMAKEILGHDSRLSDDPSQATVAVTTLRNIFPETPEVGDLTVEGLNGESKLPGVGTLLAVHDRSAEDAVPMARPQRRVNRLPRPPVAVTAPPYGVGLYPPPVVDTAQLEWATDEIINGVTLTTQIGPEGGGSLMQSPALATSMRGRLLRGSLEQLESEAATTIQRCFRGWQARADLLLGWDFMRAQHDMETQAATLIQAAFRGVVGRRKLRQAWVTPLSSAAQLSVIFDFDAELTKGLTLMHQSRHIEAVASFELCHQLRPDTALPPYYLAGCMSALSDLKVGIKWLDMAVLLGMDINELMRDPDLKRLRYHPELEVHYGAAQLRYEAAVRLQAVARGGLVRAKLERTVWDELRAEAAVPIQAVARGWIFRRRLHMEREAAKASADFVKLQAFLRGQLCRRELKRQVEAATTITSYRRMRVLRRMFLLIQRLALETNAVIMIQRRERGRQMRKDFRAMREEVAAIVVQTAYRGFAARLRVAKAFDDAEREVATLHIQKCWRGQVKRQDLLRQMRDALDDMDYEAATVLQAAWRGWVGRRCMAAERTMVRVQAIWRGLKARRQLERELEAARLIQARQRQSAEIKRRREQAATVIQAAFRGWVVRQTIEMERCIESLVSMQAIRRGAVARRGVGRMQLKELQERERQEKALIKVQAMQRGKVARRKNPTRQQKQDAALILQRLLRTIEPREELIALKLRSRAALEATLALQAHDEMTRRARVTDATNRSRATDEMAREAVDAVVQVALEVTEKAGSAASASLPPPRPSTPEDEEDEELVPLDAQDWYDIVEAEEESEHSERSEQEGDNTGAEDVAEVIQEKEVFSPTPDPNDWSALAARERQQQASADRPPRPHKKAPKSPGATKAVEHNPFGPAGKQRSRSTPGTLVPGPLQLPSDGSGFGDGLPGTWSAEAQFSRPRTSPERPRTSPERQPRPRKSPGATKAVEHNPFGPARKQRSRSTPGPLVSGPLQLPTDGSGANGDGLSGTWSAEAQFPRPRTSPADARRHRSFRRSAAADKRPRGPAAARTLEENPFGPTANLYSGSAGPIRQRSRSTPGPIAEPLQLTRPDYSVAELPGTWSAEAQFPRPRTAPDSMVDNAILSWDEKLFADPSPSELEALASGGGGGGGGGAERRGNRQQTLSGNPFAAPAPAPEKGLSLSRSTPGPNQHLEAAANIQTYLGAKEGDHQQETEHALRLAESISTQLQGTWSSDAPRPRPSADTAAGGELQVYGPRPRKSPGATTKAVEHNPFGPAGKQCSRSTAGPLQLPTDGSNANGDGLPGTWSAEAQFPRPRTSPERPRTSPERQPRSIEENPFAAETTAATKTQRSQSIPGEDPPMTALLKFVGDEAATVDGTWSAEANAPRPSAAVVASSAPHGQAPEEEEAAKKTSLPLLPLPIASEERRCPRPSTSDAVTSSRPGAMGARRPGRHSGGLHSPRSRGRSRSRGRGHSRSRGQARPSTGDRQPPQRQQRQQRERTPEPAETPEQALAKLVSPSELAASLPARRNRNIDPAEHLGDALAGTWGHISPRQIRSTGSARGKRRTTPREHALTGHVTRQRWSPKRDKDAEGVPFVNSLGSKYGPVPSLVPKQKPEPEPEPEAEPVAVVLVEMSAQEKRLLGALGYKSDDRKHVP